jgi:Zn-dependent M32 family carboxypeptidase
MPEGIHDPRDIPVLTEAIDTAPDADDPFDAKAVHAAVVSETLNLADSLLHQAAKDIEAALFEKVFDQLRARLPELLDRVIREHGSSGEATPTAVAPGAES